MTIMDPISDMFSRIRNALLVKKGSVVIPHSKLKLAVCKILKDEGFIEGYEVVNEDLAKKKIKIALKYNAQGNAVISKIERASKPSRRIYVEKAKVPKPLNGFGVSIISTSKGVLSGRDARLKNVGGELLGIVY